MTTNVGILRIVTPAPFLDLRSGFGDYYTSFTAFQPPSEDSRELWN